MALYNDNERPPYFLTAYEIAVKHGFRGTEQDWLNSLTAFGQAQIAGFVGTIDEWLEVLIDPVPNLQIGTVITLEAGSMATAQIRGDKKNPLLDLGIPKGAGAEDSMTLAGGKMQGNIDMDGHTIQNLPTPMEDGQATPKSYVDKRLKKDGTDAMEGDLNMANHYVKNLPTPTEDGHATPKSYVDKRLKKDGTDAMEGDLNMANHYVKNLPTPTEDGHAAPKSYVDGKHLYTTLSLKAASWTGTAAPYSQSVTVPGFLAKDVPHCALVYSGDGSAWESEDEAWAMVNDVTKVDGAITFICFRAKPAVDITIALEVNR